MAGQVNSQGVRFGSSPDYGPSGWLWLGLAVLVADLLAAAYSCLRFFTLY
jgi:hypothetical protein